jgi:hypothetical protein
MAVMPGVQYRPVPNKTTDGMRAHYGVALHIMQGTLWGSDAWFRNPKAQASSHFGVGKDGTILQWVDTKDRAWAQASGNPYWISIEHEGKSGDSLTPEQIAADGKILAWVHKTHGVPLQSTNSVTGRGLGWHGMGGADWGGHTACPGTPIKNQRTAILKAAGSTPAEPSAPPVDQDAFPGASKFGPGADNAYVTRLGQMLVKRGAKRFYTTGPGPKWGMADKNATSAFQQAQGWTGADADGIPGATTWKLLTEGRGKDIPALERYQPYPGDGFFHGGRNSPLVTALGRRLVALGFGKYYSSGPGPDWTNADKQAVAAFQRSRPELASDADGIPGPKTWAALKVPKI